MRSPVSLQADAIKRPKECVSIVRPEEDVLSAASPSHQVVRGMFAGAACGPTQVRLPFETSTQPLAMQHVCVTTAPTMCQFNASSCEVPGTTVDTAHQGVTDRDRYTAVM